MEVGDYGFDQTVICIVFVVSRGNVLVIVWDVQMNCAGLGGSVGCAVRLETRRSRVQPPPRSATFFRGD